MPHPHISHLPLKAVDRLLGRKSNNYAWRNRGKLGEAQKRPGSKALFVSLDLVEAVFGAFDPTAIEDAFYSTRPVRFTANDLRVLIFAALDDRDRQWAELCPDIEPPPRRIEKFYIP